MYLYSSLLLILYLLFILLYYYIIIINKNIIIIILDIMDLREPLAKLYKQLEYVMKQSVKDWKSLNKRVLLN
jgi:hypothetical protein